MVGLRATPRHQPLLDVIVPDERTGLLPDSPPECLENIPDAADDPRVIWVPATQRPSPPAVHAVLPSFHLTPGTQAQPAGCVTQTHTASIRVWLERPWFSSGEGERLGVVIWPPRFVLADQGKLREGFVPRPFRSGVDAQPGPRDQPFMALADFTDDDLGPGSKSVTRWGADPIRAGDGPCGPFMPVEAFMDIDKDLQALIGSQTLPETELKRKIESLLQRLADPAAGAVGYVAGVPMPLYPEGKAGASAGSAAAASTMLVDLITYQPRFDADSERWFVDVGINPTAPLDLVEPFVRLGLVRYQPHGLQKSGAAPDLRVSAPIPADAWAQVLPRSEVFVWRDPPAADAPCTGRSISVQVSGPVAARAYEGSQLQNPRRRMALVAVERLANGLPIATCISQTGRHVLGPESDVEGWVTVARGSPVVQTGMSGGAWVCRLWEQQDAPDGACPVGELFVKIEELEDYRSTDDEALAPVSAAPTQTTVQGLAEKGKRVSGPKFSTMIKVPA